MFDLMCYLLVHCHGPDDHLLGLFPVHVIEAQRIDVGGQVTSHLIKHIQYLKLPFLFLANGRNVMDMDIHRTYLQNGFHNLTWIYVFISLLHTW